jgi:hypothetical protein
MGFTIQTDREFCFFLIYPFDLRFGPSARRWRVRLFIPKCNRAVVSLPQQGRLEFGLCLSRGF